MELSPCLICLATDILKLEINKVIFRMSKWIYLGWDNQALLKLTLSKFMLFQMADNEGEKVKNRVIASFFFSLVSTYHSKKTKHEKTK